MAFLSKAEHFPGLSKFVYTRPLFTLLHSKQSFATRISTLMKSLRIGPGTGSPQDNFQIEMLLVKNHKLVCWQKCGSGEMKLLLVN